MMLALLWLTVSIPFVYTAQQQLAAAKIAATGKAINNNDSGNNPFANTTEEKTPSGVNTLSEYLHDTHPAEHPLSAGLIHSHDLDVATYIAFNGELTGPPPKA
jgi:hypothetical protein